MSYKVLARKYRSQSFDDVIGQNPISQTLKNAIKTDKVAHAFLFVGTRGVGKTTMARILAKALNCLEADQPTTQPCCKCDSCIAVNHGDDIDVIEIDGASNNGVEEVRRLRENAIYRPTRARHKIYIIDEVHMLSTAAFNALLKILEEPPDHVKFIFATTEPNKVIPTIQSRCQRFDFNNISPAKIVDHLKDILKKEDLQYEQDLLPPIAKMANGSMRDALSMLDRIISTGSQPLNAALLEEFLGCPNSEKINQLIEAIGNSDAAATLQATENLITAGLSEAQIADALTDFLRDMMVLKSAGENTELLVLTADQRKRAAQLAEKFDTAAIIYNITVLEKLRWSIKNTDTPRALLEASLLRFALAEHFLNVESLLSQARSRPIATIKKKTVTNPQTNPTPIETKKAEPEIQPPQITDIGSIKNNWQTILQLISTNLGNGTASLLSKADPTKFENGFLTLTFPASAEMSKKMCESNSRLNQIESLLAENFSSPLRLKFALADGQQKKTEQKTNSEITNEIIDDPAVKTLLTGLGATITGIQEKPSEERS